MDKYEYKLKLDELRELFQLKNYEGAAEIADEINWNKVRNAKTLCMVADVYEALERYDSCQDVLMQAYDHSSVGRNIVSRLTDIAIKSKDVESAEEYYNEFIELAPKDTQGYVFAYKIACLKNAPLADRIAILEEFKEREYSEMWAYELAVLYAQAGMREKCVETCDELILWFGDGEYVERALDLKRSFQPLTASQEERYQKLLSQRGMVEINIPQKSSEAVVDTPDAEEIPTPDLIVTATKFNTQNLQDEISKSMQQIMEATEENTVRDRLNSIKKIVQDIPYLEGEEEVSLSQREKIQEEVNQGLKSDFQEKLVEETAYGSSTVKNTDVSEDTSGMSIEEILADWEKTKAVAEQTMAAAEQKKLDLEKEQALAEANDILRRLQELVPILSATPGEDIPTPDNTEGTVAEELLTAEPIVLTPVEEREPLTPKEKEETSFLDSLDFATGRLPDIDPTIRQVNVESFEDWPVENPDIADVDLEAAAADLEAAAAADIDIEAAAADIDIEAAAPDIDVNVAAADLEAAAADIDIDAAAPDIDVNVAAADLEAAAADIDVASVDVEPDAAAGEAAAAEIDVDIAAADLEAAAAEIDVDAAAADLEAAAENGDAAAADLEAAAAEIDVDAAAADLAAAAAEIDMDAAATEELNRDAFSDIPEDQEGFIAAQEAAAAEQSGAGMSDEMKSIFAYFIPIPGMSEQISAVLSETVKDKSGAVNSSRGNVIVQGEEGCGKTTLATSLIRAIQMTLGSEDDKIGKISADALNNRSFASLIPKIAGGYLIIEKAGNLNKDTVTTMAQAMDQDTQGMTVFLEDDSAGIRRVMSLSFDFASKFTSSIKIPIFTIDELVDFGKAYALEQECEIEEMAVLALYNRINNIQKVDHPTTLTEVKEIVDQAINNAENGGIKKIFAKKYNDSDYLILHEEDFA